MKFIRRLLCNVFGHKEPDVYVTDKREVIVYCTRCFLVLNGRIEAAIKEEDKR